MLRNAHVRTARDTIRNPLATSQIGFLELVTDSIRGLLKIEEAAIEQMKREISLIEKAGLHIRRGKKGFRFSAYTAYPKKIIGITSDQNRINALARGDYLKERIKESELHARHLRKVLDSAEQERCDHHLKLKMKKYRDAQLDLSRILFTKEQNEWIDEPYSPNPYYQEDLKHPTGGNVWMRSKSEKDLGNTLEGFGLPYRYDDIVIVGSDHSIGQGRRSAQPARDSYFADFKVPNLCGGITVHEHLGAVHLERYSGNALTRLNDYHEGNVCELPNRPVKHSEFTSSMEYELREEPLLHQVIHRMLLPTGN